MATTIQTFDHSEVRKSSYSSGNDPTTCVGLVVKDEFAAVLDTKMGEDSPVLGFPADTFAAFRSAIKGGKFSQR